MRIKCIVIALMACILCGCSNVGDSASNSSEGQSTSEDQTISITAMGYSQRDVTYKVEQTGELTLSIVKECEGQYRISEIYEFELDSEQDTASIVGFEGAANGVVSQDFCVLSSVELKIACASREVGSLKRALKLADIPDEVIADFTETAAGYLYANKGVPILFAPAEQSTFEQVFADAKKLEAEKETIFLYEFNLDENEVHDTALVRRTSGKRLCLAAPNYRIHQGDKRQIIVDCIPQGYTPADLLFRSDNEAAVKVSESGTIEGVSNGAATVTVSLRGTTASVSATVMVTT